jgi:S1-C subfamily serine protease
LIVEVLTSSLAGRRFGFSRNDLLRGVMIGRAPDCKLRFDSTRDVRVSGHHALIVETRDGVFVRDQGSSNGLYVNNQRVAAVGIRVFDGADVRLGAEGAQMRFLIPGEIQPAGPQSPGSATVRETPESLTKFVNKVGDRVGAGDKTKRMIKEVADRLESRAEKRRARIVILVIVLFLLVVACGAAGIWYYLQQERDRTEQQEQAEAEQTARELQRLEQEKQHEQELAAMRAKLSRMEGQLAEEARQLRDEQEKRFVELKRTVDADTAARVKEIADEQLKDLREATDEQKRRLEELQKPPSEQVFRRLSDQYNESVFLIYVQYTLLDKDGNAAGVESGTGTGWLAGVSEDAAWVITNKHVIKPFMFKPEIAIAHAIRDVKPAPVADWVIAAWPQGARIREHVGDTDLAVGEAWAQLPNGTGGRGGLSVAGFADDEWREFGQDYATWLERSGFRTNLPAPMIERIKRAGVHNMDTTNDLAVLRFERRKDGKLGKPLPIATDEQLNALHQLDPVMALGYPLGLSVIKGTTVTTSPATGEIRSLQWEVGVIGTSAPILPGNSGGPLIDSNGRVIGVITRRFESAQGEAISAAHARKLLLSVVK